MKTLLGSLLLVAAAAIAACGPGNGSTTQQPGLSTPQPGSTQPAEMTPASTAGLNT